jgi:hypothetical protein
VRNLVMMDLSDVPLSRSLADVAGSPHLAKLQKLNVSNCGLGGDGLDKLLKAKFAKNLVALNVAGNELNAVAVAKLAKWKGAAHLETLTISEYHQYRTRLQLGDDAARAFASGNWAGLRGLALNLYRAGTDGLDALSRCASLAGLRSLSISHAQDANVDSLLLSPHLASLEALHLHSRANQVALASAPMLPTLRGLYLHSADEASVRAILSAPASSGLRELSIRGPKDGRAVASILANSSHLSGLRALTLSDVPLGAEGARTLSGVAHLAGLVKLFLRGNTVDEAAARALVAAPPDFGRRLRRLVVGGGFPGLFGPPYEALEARFGKDVVTRN